VVSRLDFYRNPDWMKQFPFAQTYTMTIRLKDGVLEVNTRIDNLSTQPLPVSIGYHPYFALPETDRNQLVARLRRRDSLDRNRRPPADRREGNRRHVLWRRSPRCSTQSLRDKRFDEVFSDLDRDAQGRASVVIRGDTTSIKVTAAQDPNLPSLLGNFDASWLRCGWCPWRRCSAHGAPPAPPPTVAYDGPVVPLTAPNDVPRNTRGFIAIEPMVGITDSMNMAQKGQYNELQYIAPGGSWNESIWISPSGY